MTIQETTKILTLLSGFYGNGKAEVELMTAAWYEILKNYEYQHAYQAVIDYAERDRREYASFPAPGAIIQALEARFEVFWDEASLMLNFARQRYTTRDGFVEAFKTEITEEHFDKLKKLKPEEVQAETKSLANMLANRTAKERTMLE